MAPKVRDIMTSPPTAVPADADVATVARTMRDQDIGAVLVTDANHTLHGLVTDRDLVVRGLAVGARPEARVGGIISQITATVGPDDDTEAAAAIMRDRAVRRLPVIFEGRCVGIVSIGDLAMETDPRSALANISAAQPNQ